MLVLTRKTDEEIIINGNIHIKIVGISEGKVKLGITAPIEVEILRGEIYQTVKDNAIEALKQSTQKIKDLSKLKVHKLEQ
ncbi:MAG: carbon storage regulator CsrA [Ignavibacteriaceae bacterium]|nr:carbon storage regulator CsrA [Ignavibacteriaceae bacterium]